MDETIKEICGVPISDLYDYDTSSAYDFVSENFDYLKNASKEDVVSIKFSYTKDIVILFKNGNVTVNGEEKLYACKELVFLGGYDIFAITKKLEVINVLTHKELFDFKYKFKKICYDPLSIITLDEDGIIRVYGTLVNEYVDPFKLTDINDLGIIKDNVAVVKGNKTYLLFYDKEVSPEDIVVLGQENDYTIITK